MPGRNPLVHVVPPSVEVAKPISDEPPSVKRPAWKTLISVEPKENVSGSTSVACWLVAFVKMSVLSLCKVAATPVPFKVTVCGLPGPSSAILIKPALAPPPDGVKVTLIEQLAPVATIEPQLFD